MAENGQSKIDFLLWWLTIATIGSLIILFLSTRNVLYWVSLTYAVHGLIYILIQFGLWIGAISAMWSNWKKGKRKVAKIWSLVAFGLSFGLLLLFI